MRKNQISSIRKWRNYIKNNSNGKNSMYISVECTQEMTGHLILFALNAFWFEYISLTTCQWMNAFEPKGFWLFSSLITVILRINSLLNKYDQSIFKYCWQDFRRNTLTDFVTQLSTILTPATSTALWLKISPIFPWAYLAKKGERWMLNVGNYLILSKMLLCHIVNEPWINFNIHHFASQHFWHLFQRINFLLSARDRTWTWMCYPIWALVNPCKAETSTKHIGETIMALSQCLCLIVVKSFIQI